MYPIRRLRRRFPSEPLFIFFCLFWGTCTLPAQTAAARSQSLPRELQQELEDLSALEFVKEPIGSLSIGIVLGDALAWNRSFGIADRKAQRLATSRTLYRIGSVSKQFTALMLLQLVQAGKLHLSDPVEQYLPEIRSVQDRPEGSPPITLVELATMTSGLSREPEDLPRFLEGPASAWESVMLEAVKKTRYQFEPDTHYLYSNIGYAILGGALARAAGQPFIPYVEEKILQPLGMKDSVYFPNDKTRELLAEGHQVTREGLIDTNTPLLEHEGRGYKVPNGALYSSVQDLAKFVSFELGHGPAEVLPTDVWEENLSRLNSAAGDLSSGYGIGFQAHRQGSYTFLGHGGSVAGYRASVLFERETDTGVIVLRDVGGRLNVGNLAGTLLTRVADFRQKDR